MMSLITIILTSTFLTLASLQASHAARFPPTSQDHKCNVHANSPTLTDFQAAIKILEDQSYENEEYIHEFTTDYMDEPGADGWACSDLVNVGTCSIDVCGPVGSSMNRTEVVEVANKIQGRCMEDLSENKDYSNFRLGGQLRRGEKLVVVW